MTDFIAADNQDFGAMLDAQMAPVKTEFEIGERLAGVITAIDVNNIFVDIGAKSEGMLERHEFVDEHGQLTVQPGDRLEAYCISAGDEIRLTTRMTGKVADASLQEAYEAKIPVEGRVEAERKGGFAVKVASQTGFCPYSQMDIHRSDAAAYLGEKFRFVITEYDDGRNLVLSRRRLLEDEQRRQKAELREQLFEGQVRRGRVTKLMPFGVFVDIGGVEGLVPLRELGWGRDLKPEDVVQQGDEVTVVVKQIDWEQDRFSLSLRQAQGSPWDEVAEKFRVGQRLTGTVIKLMPFGAFVELEPGVDGLVHISKLGAGRRINHPDQVVSVGDMVEVSIESVDPEQQRISLSMENTSGREDMDPDVVVEAGETVAEGHEVTGVVDGMKPFGIFVKLPDGRSGLLHISQTEHHAASNPGRALEKQYPLGSQLKVVVQEIKGSRVSLTLRSTLERIAADKVNVADYQSSGGLGSLGDAFSKLEL